MLPLSSELDRRMSSGMDWDLDFGDMYLSAPSSNPPVGLDPKEVQAFHF